MINWDYPEKPEYMVYPDSAKLQKMFGPLEFVPAPTKAFPKGIKITNDFVKDNIIVVSVPQLIGFKGAPKNGKVYFHKKAANALQGLFYELEHENIMDDILTWDGAFYPRLIRGGGNTLSNHAFGIAFDINAQYNGIGVTPALPRYGVKGCVYRIVKVATKHGFFWGGWYRNRKDGMHFEWIGV